MAEDGLVLILVVDDDEGTCDLLTFLLRHEGYDVDTAVDGMAALDAVAAREPDAVILDLDMPRLDGLATCRELRARGSQVPVLMLTGYDDVAHRVTGLDVGADDYLGKAFHADELLARLRALLRRSAVPSSDAGRDAGSAVLTFADLTLDPGTREVRRGTRPIRLTEKEFALLEVFMRQPRLVLNRSLIFDRVWGYDFGKKSNRIHVYLGYLRKKLEAENEPRLLHTVRGIGFVLREHER